MPPTLSDDAVRQFHADGYYLARRFFDATEIDAVREIHDRMPVVLDEDGWRLWLDPATDPGELQGLLQPRDDLELVLYPVSRLVNDVRKDGPALIEPLAG